jgi:hypothetical protein
MTHKTLNELVRDQVLAEGPDRFLSSGRDWDSYLCACEDYIDNELNNEMSIAELLERISEALATMGPP